MSDFSVDWLSARERHDHAARSAALAERFAPALGAAPRLFDLGCGTGSNLRYLAPRISGPHHWRCVDHDSALLGAARGRLEGWARERGWPIEWAGQDVVLARPAGEIIVSFALGDLARDALPDDAEIAGVTGSALLDLTSAAWLDSLAQACRGRPLLMALSFDGRLVFDPPAQEDDEIVRRFRAHQRGDKGFGPALGPHAARYLAERLRDQGSAVTLEPADWQLGAADEALLRVTLDGVIDAVRAIAADDCLRLWAARRRKQLASGDLRLTVGHLDLLALPG